jgi:hypothetical protein
MAWIQLELEYPSRIQHILKKKIREKVWFGQVANSDRILEEYYARSFTLAWI